MFHPRFITIKNIVVNGLERKSDLFFPLWILKFRITYPLILKGFENGGNACSWWCFWSNRMGHCKREKDAHVQNKQPHHYIKSILFIDVIVWRLRETCCEIEGQINSTLLRGVYLLKQLQCMIFTSLVQNTNNHSRNQILTQFIKAS